MTPKTGLYWVLTDANQPVPSATNMTAASRSPVSRFFGKCAMRSVWGLRSLTISDSALRVTFHFDATGVMLRPSGSSHRSRGSTPGYGGARSSCE